AAPHFQSSCPGSSRASMDFGAAGKNVDGRDKPGHDGVLGRSRHIVSAAALAFILAITGFVAWVYSLGPLPLDESRQVSTTIVDRNGKLLRAYAMADGRWRLPVDAKANVD